MKFAQHSSANPLSCKIQIRSPHGWQIIASHQRFQTSQITLFETSNSLFVLHPFPFDVFLDEIEDPLLYITNERLKKLVNSIIKSQLKNPAIP